MPARSVDSLREIQRWLHDSAAEAERLLPDLLERSGPSLCREFRDRPALRTPGVLQSLLKVARGALDRFPSRAHELTAVAVRHAGMMIVPAPLKSTRVLVQGQAWRDYGGALWVVGRPAKARRALATSRSFFATLPASGWHLATVDLVEAPLLHDLGHHDEAMRMIVGAAGYFAFFRDGAHFVQARMLESSLLLARGDRVAAAEVWKATEKEAAQYSQPGIVGTLAAKIGDVELRSGHPAAAAGLFAAAMTKLREAGRGDEAARARALYADAAAARGRIDEALSEYRLAHGEMLLRGKLVDAAATAVDILDLLLTAGRTGQMAPALARFVHTLRDAGLTVNAMEALAYLRARADHDSLTRDDLRAARAYFVDLRQRPCAEFVTPG